MVTYLTSRMRPRAKALFGGWPICDYPMVMLAVRCNHCDYNFTDKCFETVYTKTIRLRKSSVEDAQSGMVPRVGEP